ncbi:RNA polymerase sigma factor [Microbacterium sulfonylureivorans]|uniref:RNA polymerase sigma factor n=1 Tax=Microbacterium sulfonylureivorans TaxID=2486854 RepID=UPI000FDC43E3|nr:RNA polymerase sigma factor [Microbacterium sulfonylureivorans]
MDVRGRPQRADAPPPPLHTTTSRHRSSPRHPFGLPDAGFADPAEYDELHQALATLPSIDRDIITLIHWEGFSLVDASRILHMKEGTLRSRYHRARAVLRAQLEDFTAPAVAGR